jgi:hypothetical protein
MNTLPKTCPRCHTSDVAYSTGVIKNTALFHDLGAIEYPVIRCAQCHEDFFAFPPDYPWQPCEVNSTIPFTKNHEEIDVNTKLVLSISFTQRNSTDGIASLRSTHEDYRGALR